MEFLLLLLIIIGIIGGTSAMVKCFVIVMLSIGLLGIAEIIITLYSLLKHRRSKWRYRDGTNDRRKRDNCKES